MRWLLIPQHDRTTRRCLTLPLALHEHMNPAVQRHDLALLPGDHITEVINDASQDGRSVLLAFPWAFLLDGP